MKQLITKTKIYQRVKKIFSPFYKQKIISKIFSILEKDFPKDKKVAMFVGGCVRKYICNEEIDDIDIATILTPEEVKKKFEGTGIKVLDTGIEHGSVTLAYKDNKFEITTLRKDIKTDGRHAQISFTDDWQLDSERRDFTINAIYLDRKGKIFDPQLGIKDLQNGVIKFIGDPGKRIEEDFLRIIRFIRFAIEYKHRTFEPSTIEAIKLNLNGIKNLSKERIFNELTKIFKLKNLYEILESKELLEIFNLIFPELKEMNHISKLSSIRENQSLKIDTDLILSSILVTDTKDYEYFCHKYKVSNSTKDKMIFLANIFEKYKSEKLFFTKYLNKKIYFYGKENLKEFVIFLYLKNKNFKQLDLLELTKKIEKFTTPNFPFNGKYLQKKGIKQGKIMGKTLKQLESAWIENDFSLSDQRANEIIKKANKLNVLNI